jgi:hypothetical protein
MSIFVGGFLCGMVLTAVAAIMIVVLPDWDRGREQIEKDALQWRRWMTSWASAGLTRSCYEEDDEPRTATWPHPVKSSKIGSAP